MPRDDLSGKNLDNVSLSGSNQQKSNLSHASLRKAGLQGTNLRDANLAGSDLHDAELQHADVTGADLSDADLTGAHLEGVDLNRASSTEGIILTGATGLTGDTAGVDRHPYDAHPEGGKADLLARIDAEWAAWDALIEAIPPAWLDLPDAIGDWSISNVIAHLNAWRQPFLNDVQAAVQGTIPPPLGWPCTHEDTVGESAEAEHNVELVNTWIHERNAARTHDQVLAESALQWAMLRALVTIMPDRLLADAAAFPPMGGQSLAARVLDGTFFSHYHDEHEPGMRAWLARMQGRPAAG